jgi:hypothetical protein
MKKYVRRWNMPPEEKDIPQDEEDMLQHEEKG